MAFAMLVIPLTASAQEAAVPLLLRGEDLLATVDQSTLQKQYDALLGMGLTRLEYSPRGPVTELEGDTGIVLPHDTIQRRADENASDLLPFFKDVLLANGTESLKTKRNWGVYGDERGLLLTQNIRGIPVINSAISIAYNGSTKRVSSVSAHFVPDRNLPRSPKLTAQEAEDVIRKAIGSVSQAKVHIRGDAFLAYFAEFGDASPPQLVWSMDVILPTAEDRYYVNAITGQIAGQDKLLYSVTRKVYDVNGATLPYFPSGLPAPLSLADINSVTSQLFERSDSATIP
jgi:hypothetical protein